MCIRDSDDDDDDDDDDTDADVASDADDVNCCEWSLDHQLEADEIIRQLAQVCRALLLFNVCFSVFKYVYCNFLNSQLKFITKGCLKAKKDTAA